VGAVRDYVNARNESLPALVRGVETELQLRLFASPDGNTPYPIEQLKNITSWQWVMDKDFNEATEYIIVADHDKIKAESVTEVVNDTAYTYTQISIPLPNTNTVELDKWLGTEKSKPGLVAELVGYDASGSTVFVLQLENFTFRNRLTGSGEPTDLPVEYLTEAQVRAVITGTLQHPFEFEFSADGSSWHSAQTADDKYYRQRISGINAEWSEAIKLLPGPQGKPGYTPVRGTDYWTDTDIAEIKAYVDEAILNGKW
jgi:hypothetical protein